MTAVERGNPYDVVTAALKTAKNSIEQAEIELDRIRSINRILTEQVQQMRAAYETITSTVGDQSNTFLTFAKQQGAPKDTPIPAFLIEKQPNNG